MVNCFSEGKGVCGMDGDEFFYLCIFGMLMVL